MPMADLLGLPISREVAEAQFPYADRVTTRLPWTQTSDTPQFTGIPIDVLYLAKIEELKQTIAALELTIAEGNNHVIDSIKTHVDQALDDRAVGGESYGVAKSIESKLDKLIEQFSNDFAQRVANPTIEHDNELNDESHAGLE